MPISLLCGACDAALTAPDAAAGKRVKCRKCGAILEVPLPEPDANSDPDFEVVEEAPTMMMPPLKKAPPPPASAKAPPPAATKPKPKPVMLEVDDDDEDDRPAPKKKPKPVMLDEDEEDDRPTPKKKPAKKLAVVEDDYDDEEDDSDDEPRPKKGKKGKAKKKAAGSNLPLLIGGGVLGVAVAGFLVWFLAIREPESAKGPTPSPSNNQPMPGGPGMPGMPPGPGMPAQPSAGWQEFKKPEFTAAIRATGQPQLQSLPTAPGIQTGNAYAFRTQNPNGAQVVTVVTLDQLGATAAQQDPNKMLESMFTGGAGKSGGTISSRSDSQLDGKPARDATLTTRGKQMFIRGAIVGNRVYMLLAGGDGVNSVQDEQVKTFFDSFKITGQ